ncbi:MAG: helix-turn-helix transcriptional regulator [Methanosarcinaceae archaeon]
MKSWLLDLIFLSDKRTEFLLLLKEGPKSVDEALEKIEVRRTSLLPQIKKLKEQNLIVQEENKYSLSLQGKIIVEKIHPLLNTVRVFEKDTEFWMRRRLDTIPYPFLNRIEEIGDYRLIEPDLGHAFELIPEFVENISNSNRAVMFFSFFHPQIPEFFLNLAKKDIELSLIINKPILERLEKDFRDETAQILEKENTSIFLFNDEEIETPAAIAASDKVMFLGLFDRNSRFDRQYIINSKPEALQWGKDLFSYYAKISDKRESI